MQIIETELSSNVNDSDSSSLESSNHDGETSENQNIPETSDQ